MQEEIIVWIVPSSRVPLIFRKPIQSGWFKLVIGAHVQELTKKEAVAYDRMKLVTAKVE